MRAIVAASPPGAQPDPLVVAFASTPGYIYDSAADIPRPDVGEVLFDSGAARHLISARRTDEYPDYVCKAARTMNLSTAAGTVRCDREFAYANDELGEMVSALVLPDTPTCLSMGEFVLNQGWHFVWQPYSQTPFAYKPDGTKIEFRVRENVVYLRDPEPLAAMPAKRLMVKTPDTVPDPPKGDTAYPPPPKAPPGAIDAQKRRA